MRKAPYFIGANLIAIMLFFTFRSTIFEGPGDEITGTELDQQYQQAMDDWNTLEEPDNEPSREQLKLSLPPANETENIEIVLWQTPLPTTPTIELETHPAVTEKQAVLLDRSQIMKLKIGDQLILPLSSGTVTAQIDNIVTHRNGDLSWQGHLQGLGDAYPISITLGKANGYATITTPDGEYALETVNGSGWVYKTPNQNDITNGSNPDYRMPKGLPE